MCIRDRLDDDRPVSSGGNLSGFLAAARKAAYETYATDERERAIVDAEYAALRTRGDARAFVAKVMSKAELFRDMADPRLPSAAAPADSA